MQIFAFFTYTSYHLPMIGDENRLEKLNADKHNPNSN